MRSALIIVLLALGLASCSKFAKVQKSNDYDYKLRMAEKYYVVKKYNYAQQLYEELFPLFKGQPQFEDLFYKYVYEAKQKNTLKTTESARALARYLLTVWNGINVTRRIYPDKQALEDIIRTQLKMLK